MREIIFRGKRTDNGEWVEGDLLHNLIYDGRENEMRIGDIYFEQGEEIHGTAVYNVDPETIGQFTGVTDINGKKIFEGDIVKTHYANAVKADFGEEVVFRGCRFCAMAKLSGGGRIYAPLYDGVPHDPRDRSVYMDRVEVIGNIHDNPELLNDEREGRE